MSTISQADYLAMLARLDAGARKHEPSPSQGPPATREVGHGGLQEQIAAHCNAQWPQWPFIQARSDKPSTIAAGAQDFTLFLPKGRLLCVETKAKGGKVTPQQLAWRLRMEMAGHKVHLCYSFNQFLELAQQAMRPPQP